MLPCVSLFLMSFKTQFSTSPLWMPYVRVNGFLPVFIFLTLMEENKFLVFFDKNAYIFFAVQAGVWSLAVPALWNAFFDYRNKKKVFWISTISRNYVFKTINTACILFVLVLTLLFVVFLTLWNFLKKMDN